MVEMIKLIKEIFVILRKSPYLQAIIIIFLILVFFSGKGFGYRNTDSGITIGFYYPLDKPKNTITYHGYFKDLGKNRKEYIAYEEIVIDFYDDNVIKAHSLAEIENEKGEKTVKDWDFVGYHIDDKYVLSYKSGKLNNSMSAGSYFLEGGINLFTGNWKGTDSVLHNVLECPYVLLTQHLSKKEVEKIYSKILEQPCTQTTGKL